MAVTVRCKTCGAMHQMGYCSPADFPFCDTECEASFQRVVELLATGGDPAAFGVDPNSLVYREATKEVERRQARALWQGRAQLEIDYYASLPRGLPNVARRYFSF